MISFFPLDTAKANLLADCYNYFAEHPEYQAPTRSILWQRASTFGQSSEKEEKKYKAENVNQYPTRAAASSLKTAVTNKPFSTTRSCGPIGGKVFVFERWRRRTEQFFGFAEFILFKVLFFALAVIGAWSLIKEHLR